MKTALVRLCFSAILVLLGQFMAPAAELITNGGFETTGGGFAWTLLTNGSNQTDSWWNINLPSGTHGGSRYEYLGAQANGSSAANNVDGTLYQTVSIPAGVSAATLSYWMKITTSENPDGQYDHFYVEIRNAGGALLQTVHSYSNLDSGSYSSWTQRTASLLNYAGQTVRIAFHGTTDSATISVFRIDDISLQTTTTAQPTLSVSPTSASPPSAAGSSNFSVSNTGGGTMSYTTNVTSGSSWLSVASGGTGGNSGTISLSYTANTGAQRTGTVQVTASGASASPTSITITQAAPSVTRALGLDVNHFRGSIAWSSVAGTGRTFAFIKATDGYRTSQTAPMFTDPNFATYVVAAKQVGLKVGAYHFARPYINSAKDEADFFVGVAGNYMGAGYLPPALDIEDPDDELPNHPVSALQKGPLSQWIREFCAEVQRLKSVRPILYMTPNFTRTLIDSDLAQFPLWIAYYPNTPDVNPTSLGPWGNTWTIMQYAVTGTSVAGVQNSPVDIDVFNGDSVALNNYVNGGATTESTPPSITAFNANPILAAVGQGFTVTYTVADSGGSHLKQVELRRANVDGTTNDPSWTRIGSAIPLSGDGPSSGSFPIDVPPSSGNYWYGVQVTDNAGNYMNERIAGVGPKSVGVATFALTNGSASPANLPAGQTATVTWTVKSDASKAVLLGTSLFPAGSLTGEIDDPTVAHNKTVNLGIGDTSVSQLFSVPAGTPAGTYDLVVGIWSDENHNGKVDGEPGDHQLLSTRFPNAITVQPSSFTLTTSTTNGSIGRSPNQSTFIPNAQVTLTATPNVGYQFTGWGGDANGTQNPLTVTMSASKMISASFSAVPYTVSVSANNGTVEKTPDQVSYQYGDQVSLTAHPAAGYQFAGWSGSATGAQNPLSITVNANKNITATFSPIVYSLTVNLSPAGAVGAGALWQIDGGTFRASGSSASPVSPGDHTVAFKTVNGWTTPPPQTITIGASQTTTATATYEAIPLIGSLKVNIGPAGAVSAGAQWQVDGGGFQSSGATLSGLSVGSHTVTFSTVSGWTTPSSQTVTINANATTTVAATYPAGAGSVQVVLTPQGAVDAGAQWRVDSGSYQNSGAAVSGLSVGTHSVAFKAISGYSTPTSQTLTVSADQTYESTGNYSPIPVFSVTPGAGDNGTVIPDYIQTVNSGGSVLLTATPALGFGVDQWLVNGTSVQSGGNSFTLSNVTADTTVQVTFAESFAKSAASFTGLLNGNFAALGYGKITLKTTAAGNLTGKVFADGRTFALTGKLSARGGFSKILAYRIGQQAVYPTVVVQLANDGTFSGKWETGTGMSYLIGGEKDMTGTAQHPILQAGRYTAHLRGENITPNGGSVRGYLFASTAYNGSTTIAGALPDGKKLSGSSRVSISGHVPMAFGLYQSAKGYVIGVAAISGSGADREVLGDLTWFKPPQASGIYSSGVAPTGLDLVGHVWTAPAAGRRLVPDFDANGGQMLVTLNGGGLNATIGKTVSLTTKNLVIVSGRTAENLAVKVSSATGAFTGSFRHSDGKTRTIAGAFVQNPAGASVNEGYFLGVTTPGLVSMTVPSSGEAFSVTVSSGGHGSVAGANLSIPDGTQTTVTATPDAGYQFLNWTEAGVVVSTNASYQFAVTQNRILVGTFTADTTSATLLQDDFNDNSLDASKWLIAANPSSRVAEEDGMMKVETTQTDHAGTLQTQALTIPMDRPWTLTRKVMLHRETPYEYQGGTKFFTGFMSFSIDQMQQFAVNYCDYDYGNYPTHGFVLSKNGAGGASDPGTGNVTAELMPLILDQWFDEKVTYDPTSGILRYSVNNNVLSDFNVGTPPDSSPRLMTIGFQAYGWWTTHWQHFDDFSLKTGN